MNTCVTQRRKTRQLWFSHMGSHGLSLGELCYHRLLLAQAVSESSLLVWAVYLQD